MSSKAIRTHRSNMVEETFQLGLRVVRTNPFHAFTHSLVKSQKPGKAPMESGSPASDASEPLIEHDGSSRHWKKVGWLWGLEVGRESAHGTAWKGCNPICICPE